MKKTLLFSLTLVGVLLLTGLYAEDYSGKKISGYNFSGKNLSGYKFYKADCSKCDFSGADLTGAEIDNADFSSAKAFNTIILDKAKVTNSKFPSPHHDRKSA